jgi:serine/threonine-protein kinase RsbT
MPETIRVRISHDADTVTARQQGRALAARLGLAATDQALVATAISELARNIVEYAKDGEIVLECAERNGKSGIVVIARDEGPGISDIELAMQDGYTTGNGLGLGLPGVRRLMDDFEIISQVGSGTTVTAKKWVR